MAFIHFDSGFAPCGFLIVKDGHSLYDEANTVLVQTDWDYPGVAARMGWVACDCGATDGTVACQHRKAADMIADAADFIRDGQGESFEELDDYFDTE